jgi:hypothetical protein
MVVTILVAFPLWKVAIKPARRAQLTIFMKSLKFLSFVLVLLSFCRTTAQTSANLICPKQGVALPANATVNATVKPFTQLATPNVPPATFTIPVVFHLLGTTTSLLDWQVAEALDELNDDFAQNQGHIIIRFVFAGISPNGECSNGITRHPDLTLPAPGFPIPYKTLTGWDNTKYLNIWVYEVIDLAGTPGKVSMQPSTFEDNGTAIIRTDIVAGTNPTFDRLDGVEIIGSEIYPIGVTTNTLTHEVGHYLNLLHIWGSDKTTLPIWQQCHNPQLGLTQGDFIMDTPPTLNDQNQSDCDLIDHYCGDNIPEDGSSFMGYAFQCQNKFTTGQRWWMYDCLTRFRPDLWSASNLLCTGNNPYTSFSNHIISSVQTWTVADGDRSVTGELRILNGGKLIIDAGVLVRFCEKARLVVEPGGILELKGTLTNSCSGKLWDGVEIQGTPSQNQYQGLQGKFIGKVGAIVENSRNGIRAGDSGSGLGGGILQCNGTTFYNNKSSVQFKTYENHSPAPSEPVTGNSSFFNTCTFIIDENYAGENLTLYSNGQESFLAFVHLLKVRNIRFNGCSFSNNRTDFAQQSKYGNGILTSDASITVGDFCTGSSIPCAPQSTTHCNFNNLDCGIYITNTNNVSSPKAYTIKDARFTGCWNGVRSDNGSNCTIIKNKFSLGFNQTQAFGIGGYFYGVRFNGPHTNIVFEENDFSQDPSSPVNIFDTHVLIGTDITSIGDMNNVVRKNIYKNLTIGNTFRGDGAGPGQETGLHFICNTNNGNVDADFSTSYYANQRPARRNQGEADANQLTGFNFAGNTFSQINGTESDFRYDVIGNLIYYHSLTPIQIPISYSISRITLNSNTGENTCASIFCPNPPCQQELSALNAQVETAVASYESLKAQLALNPSSEVVAAIEQDMAMFQDIIQKGSFQILNNWLADEENADFDYIGLIKRMNAYETDLRLLQTYLANGDLESFSQLQIALPSKHNLTNEELDDFNEFVEILNLIQQQNNFGLEIYQLPNAVVESIKAIADFGKHTRSKILAQQIMALYGIFYPIEPMESVQERTEFQVEENTSKTEAYHISVVPNSASNHATVLFSDDLVRLDLNGILSIHDAQGKLVLEIPIRTANSQISLKTMPFPNGIYRVVAAIEGIPTITQHLVVSK